ncbi:MAG: hypothetical protein GTN64_05750 [Candidatus Latescibacteria bacterium]|nr:hypothetical protein [Candidatus Latescibacterota bacterium]NIO78113.1 hypothetical protein [Candidatus Latescibacterota bacterium]
MPDYKQEAGGSGNTGQTTIGPNDRKLTKGEAGYRENQGVTGLRCGDCLYFEASECQIVEGRIDEDNVCDQFEANLKDGHMGVEQATLSAASKLVEDGPAMGAFEMWIYRVAEKDGVRRWYSTSSGIKKDLYEERMSTVLFDNFIERIEKSDQYPIPVQFTSDAWNGGLPYLGVAHYLDLDGFGIAGDTDAVWRDGKVLKMKGTFRDTPLAHAAFDAIQQDRLQKRADNERVRVSIAFIDWGHNHGDGRKFVRKSLGDQCVLCEAGVGEKEYTAGQLVHLALTRRPAYLETEIVAMEERSMTKRHGDAASIVGKEMADELEAKSNKFVGRSDGDGKVAAGAVVVKDESGELEEAVVTRTLGGAVSLDEAEAFLAKSDEGIILLTPYELLSVVVSNIIGDEEKSAAAREVLRDFQTTLDARTANAVIRIERALGGESMTSQTGEAVERQVPPQFAEHEEEERKRKRRPEEEMSDEEEEEVAEEDIEEEGEGESEEEEDKEKMSKKSVAHPLEAAFQNVREAFDEAMETPGDTAMKLRYMQESVNSLGAEITAKMQEAAASAPVDAATISRAVAEALAPIQAELRALSAQVQAGKLVETEKKGDSGFRRRAIRMPTASLPTEQPVQRSAQLVPTEDNPTPKIRQLARASTIGYERRMRGGV